MLSSLDLEIGFEIERTEEIICEGGRLRYKRGLSGCPQCAIKVSGQCLICE